MCTVWSIGFLTSWVSKQHITCINWPSESTPKVADTTVIKNMLHGRFSLLLLLAFRIYLWQRTSKLWFFTFLSFKFLCPRFHITLLNLGLLCDQKAIKTPKLNTIWLEVLAKVLNMLIGLKGNNYYSKVFKRVNYKLWNSTFWVVISWHTPYLLMHKGVILLLLLY